MAITDERFSATGVSPETVDRLVTAFEKRLDEVVDNIAHAYRELIPSYGAASPKVIEEIRQLTTMNVRVCIGVLKNEIDFDALKPLQAESARIRAAQGFPLHEVLLAYQIGTRIFYDEMLKDIAPHHPDDWAQVVSYVTQILLDLVRHSTETVCRAYLEFENARVAQDEHDFQVLTEILVGVRDRDPAYLDRAVRRGIDMTALQCCAVMQSDDERIARDIQALRTALKEGVVGRIGRLITAFTAGEVPAALPVSSPVGTASDPDPATAYRRAQAAYEVAAHLSRERVRYDEVMPLAMVFEGSEEQRETFVRTQLGRVLDDPLGPDLLDSLAAYYAQGQSVAAAARALHVHRHTLEYRLERVTRLLDADLRDPARRLFLELALALRSTAA